MIKKYLRITQLACIFLLLILLVSCGAETSVIITDGETATSKTSGNDRNLPVEETNWLDMFECEFSSATMNCTITKYIGKETTVVVPEKINGYTVKEIGDSVFLSYGQGETMFNSTITSISLPDTIATIGNAAFFGCSRLKELKLPKGLEAIPSQMCERCHSLKTVNLPDSLISIGHRAFYDCAFLTNSSKLVLPDHIQYVGNNAFATEQNPVDLICINYSQDNGFVIVGDGCLYKYQGNEKNVVIPDGVKIVGEFAFRSNKEIESVVIPDGVNLICTNAFAGCESLSQVTIPDSVIKIESWAFAETSSLKQFHFSKKLEAIEEYAFLHSGLTSINLFECELLTNIGNSAFACDSLSEIVIYAGAAQTNFWAFYPAYKNNAKITVIPYEAD